MSLLDELPVTAAEIVEDLTTPDDEVVGVAAPSVALVPKPLLPSTWAMLKDEAQVLVQSGLLPDSVHTWQTAVAIMLTGRELGLGPMAAFSGINVIRGRPALSGQLMLALIQRSGLLAKIEMYPSGADEYVVVMQRKGQEPHAEKFTLAMARQLGLDVDGSKSQWSRQLMTMLKWRSVSACARVVFPDVIMGLYTDDELRGEEEHTVTVEAEWAPVEEAPRATIDLSRLDAAMGGK